MRPLRRHCAHCVPICVRSGRFRSLWPLWGSCRPVLARSFVPVLSVPAVGSFSRPRYHRRSGLRGRARAISRIQAKMNIIDSGGHAKLSGTDRSRTPRPTEARVLVPAKRSPREAAGGVTGPLADQGPRPGRGRARARGRGPGHWRGRGPRVSVGGWSRAAAAARLSGRISG